MIRPLTVIVSAILLTQPTMAPSTARGYAEVIRQESRDHHVDPLTVVALVHYESQWRVAARNGDCFGLGQICLTNYRYCREDMSGAQCQSRRLALLDGRTNLRAVFTFITINREFCRKKTGRAKLHHWLASFGGLNNPSRGIWCGQHRVRGRWQDVPMHRITRRVMDRRRELVRRFPQR